jgi:hypothetical protein
LKQPSNTSILNWFNQNFPDTAISPHHTDTCDTCSCFNKDIESVKQKIQLHEVFLNTF